jgi:hypothetical protein
LSPIKEARYQGGSDSHFQDLLDPDALKIDWLENPIKTCFLSDWDSELYYQVPGKTPVPLFQTGQQGSGVLAVWTVPLSTVSSSLIVSTGWVPLFSQMLKRVLVGPDGFDEKMAGVQSMDHLEADLTPATESTLAHIKSLNIHSHSADEMGRSVANLPQNRHDWTMLVMLLCLILACIEIGVSNLL